MSNIYDRYAPGSKYGIFLGESDGRIMHVDGQFSFCDSTFLCKDARLNLQT